MAAQPTGLPGTDPLWAWDTPKWTNQSMGTTVTAGLDLEGAVVSGPGPLSNSFAAGAGLSGFGAQTMDPAGTTVTSALTTNVFFGALVWVGGDGFQTSHFSCNNSTITSQTHAYLALLDVFGNTLIASSDTTSSALSTGAGVAWASSGTFNLSAGYYYLGVATTGGSSVFQGATAGAVAVQNQTAYSAAAPYVFPRFVKSTSTVTISSTFPTSITLVVNSGIGAPLIGIY